VSSIAAYAPQHGDVLVETMARRPERHWIAYVATKWAAEQVVLDAAAEGFPAVVVQPGNILGPGDARNWAQLFWRMQRGEVPGVPPGGAPWCHVESVVQAMLAAAAHGAPGERFLIAGRHASYAEVFGGIADRVGVSRPPRLPAIAVRLVGQFGGWSSLLTGREPLVTPEKSHFATIDFRADCTRARERLGYDEVGLDRMLDDTCAALAREGRI
jgi:nucleoside-diphosphate-sugar epimerase